MGGHRSAALIALVVVAACSNGSGEATSEEETAPPAETTAPETTATTTPEPAELYPDHTGQLYAGTTNWICHPDVAADPCDDIASTVVAADGSRTLDNAAPASETTFDCFYVYPTTSADPGVNSDLVPDESEIDTVRAQFARYASVCRTFAPVYRSITLAGLGGGGFAPEPRELAYGDVLDAWRTYIDELGEGRGVVVIGHSQGAGHLRRLVEEEVDPSPEIRARLISAVLLGTSVGELPNLPACTSTDDVGCIISFSSYPADQPPVDGALFGTLRDSGSPALCVDPVALAGGNGLADAVIPTRVSLLGGSEGFPGFDTPFISLPDALRTACAVTGPYGYLAVSLTGVEDARPLEGLLVQRLGPTWGLHLFDANLVQDDLIEVVSTQAEAFVAG